MRPSARTRHRNLEILIREAGSARALARRTGTSDSYLSQLRNRTPRADGQPRRIGDRLAARLEGAMHKPPGWLDEAHGAPGDEEDSRDGGSWDRNGADGLDGRLCPLLSWAQAADPGALAGAIQEEARTMLRCPARCGADTFVLRVRDASMAPRFHDGDLIFVDPNTAQESGCYVVVRIEGSGEAAFMQLVDGNGRRYLRALNPDWPHPIVEASDVARICGVVVFRGEHV